ncbi:TonB-dependent receptor [Rapidithrix thailandica]|uniref:TonB-dependent receptor n=1 Tax=Rapidithrix thailandica TaxID=413964 RepID=A0AAW9SCZ8_9BACT
MKRLLLNVIGVSLCLLCMQAYAQERTVTGTVTASEDGAPLPGVSVLVKSTNTGGVTDIDGKFRIALSENAEVLIFSFVGYESQEVAIGNQSVINVSLKGSEKLLEEVVVVGYGTQIKQDLTGNIAKVSGEEIKEMPVQSFEQTLQGRTTGVFIESSNGKPGEAIKVRVRGSSSVSASNQPLYVVDGIPVTSENQGITNNQPTNPLADINFNDVESIEVLKDASAAAIYGSRAANGVVIITTKRGKAGKTKIDLSYQTGFSKPTNKIGFLNAAEYRELYTEATLRYLGIDPVTATEQDKQDAGIFLEETTGLVPGFVSNTETDENWEDIAFQDAVSHQANFSMTGGNEKTQFYIGGNYFDQEGILLGTGFERFSGRLNLDHQAFDRLKVGGGLSLSRTELERVSNDNAFSTPLQLVAQAPVTPAYDPETGEPNRNTIYDNGLVEFANSESGTENYRMLGNIYGELTILPGLRFRTDLGVDLLDQQEENYSGITSIDGRPSGLGESRKVRVINFNTNNFLTYSKSFNKLHNLDVTLGMSFQRSSTQLTSLQAKGFPHDELNTIASAVETVTFIASEEDFSFLSYFARANYKFNNRYLLNVSARIDGSSKFGKDNRYGFFPAVSAGWILSEESFLDNLGVLSFLKLRASYGLTGNAPTSNFAHLSTYKGVNYAGKPGLRPWTLPSPDLKWEETTQMNFGLDFGLWNDRITGEIDYYIKNTTDLLLSRTLPATSGYTSIFENVGEMENKGIELLLNVAILQQKPFSWDMSFNIARNENEVVKLLGTDIIGNPFRVREGEPLGVFVTRKYAGVNPDNGDALYADGEGGTTADYNLAPNMVVGDPNPDFVGGFTNNFSWNGFDLNVFFQFVQGNDIYVGSKTYSSSNASSFLDNQTKDQMRRWQKPGDITDVPRAELVGGIGDQTSSRYVEDGSYIRLKTITLGYNFPKTITDKLFLRSLRVYVSGLNLWTITDYTGWDPEVNYTGTNRSQTNTNLIQGYDFYTAPQPKTWSFGVNIGL